MRAGLGFFLQAAACVFFLPGFGQAATIYSTTEDASLFGWLDQYSLDTAAYNYVGPEACVPTVATNALTYLQNLAPATFGTGLTGATYTSWMSAATTLISPAYMNTSPSSGTYFRTIPSALTEYIIGDQGFESVQFSGMFQTGFWTDSFPQPDYIADGVPTASFLYQALSAKSALMLSIVYSNGNGHELLATGFNWLDDGNGIIDFGENATLSFVDPLDPSASYPGGQPGGGAKITSGHLWYDASLGGLRLNYSQYQGELPYDSADYASYTVRINNAFVMTVVPEPCSGMLLLLGGLVVSAQFRRRSLRVSKDGRRSWPAV